MITTKVYEICRTAGMKQSRKCGKAYPVQEADGLNDRSGGETFCKQQKSRRA